MFLTPASRARGSRAAFPPPPYVTGDIPYASAPGIVSMLPDVAVGKVLVSGGVGAPPAWSNTIAGPLTFAGTLSINPTANTLTQGLSVTQYAAGTATSPALNNRIIFSDQINGGSGFVFGEVFTHSFGGGATQGGRQAFTAIASLDAPTNASNTNHFYVAGTFLVKANGVGDNGGAGTEKGQLFGLGAYALALSGATYLSELSAAEFDMDLRTGASALWSSGLKIAKISTSTVQGSAYDVALWFVNQNGAIGWKDGILFDAATSGVFPVASTGNILRTGAGAFATGIDFSASTYTTAFKSVGFEVGAVGKTTFNIASTVVSATAATLRDVYVQAATTTITGNTGSPITALHKVYFGRPIYTNSLAVTVTGASTVYIDNAPLAAGSVTLTNTYALWVNSGNAIFGAGGANGTASPRYISLGGDYSTSAGANIKLRIYDDMAGTIFGMGLSAGQLDYVGGNHGFYSGGALQALVDTNGIAVSLGNLRIGTANKTLVLKQGANGCCGTFVANGVTPVTITNSNIAVTDSIIISLNTVGGTVGVQPHIATITASTSFTVICTALDTSTYNYAIIKNAA